MHCEAGKEAWEDEADGVRRKTRDIGTSADGVQRIRHLFHGAGFGRKQGRTVPEWAQSRWTEHAGPEGNPMTKAVGQEERIFRFRRLFQVRKKGHGRKNGCGFQNFISIFSRPAPWNPTTM